MRIKALTCRKEVVYIVQFLERYGVIKAVCVDNCGRLFVLGAENLTVIDAAYVEVDYAN